MALVCKAGGRVVAAFDEESLFGTPRPKGQAHEIGENIDALSARELGERVELLKREVERLETAIRAREATRTAAGSVFKI
jgi:uncharacterized small protein (DUF1192 family)